MRAIFSDWSPGRAQFKQCLSQPPEVLQLPLQPCWSSLKCYVQSRCRQTHFALCYSRRIWPLKAPINSSMDGNISKLQKWDSWALTGGGPPALCPCWSFSVSFLSSYLHSPSLCCPHCTLQIFLCQCFRSPYWSRREICFCKSKVGGLVAQLLRAQLHQVPLECKCLASRQPWPCAILSVLV